MLNPQWIWFGLAVNLVAGIAVVVQAVRANIAARRGAAPDTAGVQPNRITWFVWSVTAWIAFAGQTSQGVQQAAALTAVVAIVPTLILAATFIDRQPWTASRLDKTCLTLSALALLLWQLTASGDVAIALSILVDAIAAVPTVVKAYQAPESEGAGVYVAGILSGGLTLLTLEETSFASAGFATYFLVLCTVMSILLVVVPRLRGTRPTHSPAPATGGPGSPAESGSVAAFAGAFAADYMSWDGLDPQRRGRALAAYLHNTRPEHAAFLGWDGHGRQRVDLILLGSVEHHPTSGGYTVDVRVRYTTYLPDPAGPASNGRPYLNGHHTRRSQPPANTVVSSAPPPDTPGWYATASSWTRLSVQVCSSAGALVVLLDRRTATTGAPRPPAAARQLAPDTSTVGDDGPPRLVPWLTDPPT